MYMGLKSGHRMEGTNLKALKRLHHRRQSGTVFPNLQPEADENEAGLNETRRPVQPMSGNPGARRSRVTKG